MSITKSYNCIILYLRHCCPKTVLILGTMALDLDKVE